LRVITQAREEANAEEQYHLGEEEADDEELQATLDQIEALSR
jgi:hypothetical protein